MSALMAKLARSRCLWQTLTVVIVRSCGQADLQTAAGSLRFREGPHYVCSPSSGSLRLRRAAPELSQLSEDSGNVYFPLFPIALSS